MLEPQVETSPTARVSRAHPEGTPRPVSTFLTLLTAFGLYLTIQGYRSFESDQSYRLPLLLARQDASLYRGDPFIQAFATFNPHEGYLSLLDVASRVLGLPATLFLLFLATFLCTGWAVLRLVRAVWPSAPTATGGVCLLMFLCAKAGNIGTNHLFEPMLLDRLMAFGLGWLAFAELVEGPRRMVVTISALILAARWIHPALGLQLGLVLAGCLAVCCIIPGRVGLVCGRSGLALLTLVAILGPAILDRPRASRLLFAGLPEPVYLTLAAYVQSPQHMIPHLWRDSQIWAWFGFVAIACVSAACHACGSSASRRGRTPAPHLHLRTVAGPSAEVEDTRARLRLGIMLALLLVGLAGAWFGIERLHHAKLTLFQPFRLATVVRGLCLVFASRHIVWLWDQRTWHHRARAAGLVLGLLGDWSWLVAVTLEFVGMGLERMRVARRMAPWMWLATWLIGIGYLSQHDTEGGALVMALALGVGVAGGVGLKWGHRLRDSNGRRQRLCIYANLVPALAILVNLFGSNTPAPWELWLLNRVRVVDRPLDDFERLSVWCRENTPEGALFIGPPGPKDFRLWSRRGLLFNRAGSPYHAAGLAAWADQFCDHVGLPRSPELLAQAYLKDRHGLEARYDHKTSAELASLAAAHGAHFVITRKRPDAARHAPLELVHQAGAWQVWRVGTRP